MSWSFMTPPAPDRSRHESEEVAALLQAAAIAARFSPDKISLAHDEEEAVDMALAKSRNGSLVLVRAGAASIHHDAIWDYLTHKQQSPGHHLIALGSIPPQRGSSGGGRSDVESCRLVKDGRYASGTTRE